MQSCYQLNPLSAVDVAENWQQYRAVELANISAAGRKVEIKQMVEGNGRAYLSISGALDRSLADLLAGDTPNGGVLAT
jgi:hypothetical protein